MHLPDPFIERMRDILGDEFPAFLYSYEEAAPCQALRVNPEKLTAEEAASVLPFDLRPVPWAPGGFYYGRQDRPGRHPYHEAGLYYIQEPSAMAVGALADARPGERVLDLCAAPGGKTTHLAGSMAGEGLLVANEIHLSRAKILSQNVERMGIRNAVVTRETPQRLAEHFPEFFDRIVVDAPCSGEGMFRKEEQALSEWSEENVAHCAARQQEILDAAARMLVPGGTLIYSTCTFAPAEDEGSVSTFLDRHPDFFIRERRTPPGLSAGRQEWGEGRPELARTFRIWPHLVEGEGHYAAVLGREGESMPLPRKPARHSSDRALREMSTMWSTFVRENLRRAPEGELLLFGEQLYLLPAEIPLRGLKVLRPGLHLGTGRKGRFEPSHALALAIRAEDANRTLSLNPEGEEIRAYLRGESLPCPGEKGWTLVLAGAYPIGWGKVSGGMLKNHYPKGLRKPG